MIMNKVKTLSILSLILILFNIGLLVFIFIGHRPPKYKEGRIARKVEKKLGFDSTQHEAYFSLHRTHKVTLDSLNVIYQQKLFQYIDLVKLPSIDQNLQTELLNQITQLEEKRIDLTYQHLQDLKNICTPEQLTQFPEIVDLLKKRLLPLPKKKMPPPPKD